jgi:hypothetical protein
LHFTEKQAHLRNPCASQKNRRICEILVLYITTGGFKKSLRFTEKQADLQNPCALQKIRQTMESLRALKSTRLVRKPAELEKGACPLTV